MRSGSEPQNPEAVESGKTTMQFGAADNAPVAGMARTAGANGFDSRTHQLLKELVDRLGGEHAVLEQLTACFTTGNSVGGTEITDNTDGYCYLRLFDRVEWRDASKLGPRPSVADLRRFSNGRADPFGLRTLTLVVCRDDVGRVAHAQYNSGATGLRPVEALAALAKDCRVGGIPDGPSSEFPPGWIPAKLEAYQCWDYIPGNGRKNMDFLNWVGEIRDDYCLVSDQSSRLKWVVSASPVGPETANVDVIPPNGKTMSLKRWESTVAHTKYHQDWAVRGDKIFVEVHVWRAAKFTTVPGAPLPTPPPGSGGHGELLTSGGEAVSSLVSSDGLPLRDGYCYVKAVQEDLLGIEDTLGPFPRREKLLQALAEQKEQVGLRGCVFKDGCDLQEVGSGLYHVIDGDMTGAQFLARLTSLPAQSRIGATQASAVMPSSQENISEPAQLVMRPKKAGLVINVPFAAKLVPETPVLYWDLTAGKKLSGLLAHFESAELESLSIKATVHKGDGDTIFHLAADVETEPFKSDMDWVGAPHTVHVSGNNHGATTGEMILRGDHGFGTQLKGTALGNPTPVIQGWLETTVTANVLIKAVLSIRVVGTGNPRSIVLPPRRAVGGMVNVMEDDDSDDEGPAVSRPATRHSGGPVQGSSAGKHVGK